MRPRQGVSRQWSPWAPQWPGVAMIAMCNVITDQSLEQSHSDANNKIQQNNAFNS